MFVDIGDNMVSFEVKELNRSSAEAVIFSSVRLLANHAPSRSLLRVL